MSERCTQRCTHHGPCDVDGCDVLVAAMKTWDRIVEWMRRWWRDRKVRVA